MSQRVPFVHHPAYVAKDVPPGHRFPMAKFGLLAQVLVRDGLVAPGGFHTPIPAPESWLTMAHDADYVAQVVNARVDRARARRIGFPMTASVAMRSRCATSGTLLAARLALEHGVACNTAGGSHHADREGGAGFCVFNDVTLAAEVLLAEGAVSRALVIDLDVHQGDGTARAFEGDGRVFTYSAHCEENWPRRKASSDLDRGLARGLEDEAYLRAVVPDVDDLLTAVRPDLVFYNAGVDVHRDDRLGLLALSDEGIRRRDEAVLERVMRAGAPVVGVLGGGYDRDPAVVAHRHATLHHAAVRTAQLARV